MIDSLEQELEDFTSWQPDVPCLREGEARGVSRAGRARERRDVRLADAEHGGQQASVQDNKGRHNLEEWHSSLHLKPPC